MHAIPDASVTNPARQLEEAIYYAAINVAVPAERTRFLDQACLDNAPLRAAVDAMLAAHADSERFFARCEPVARDLSAADCLATVGRGCEFAETNLFADEKTGTLIDRYQLIRRLGEGGCGVVFEAAQEAPVRRRVALKIIKLGMDSKAGVARFAAERQALALMEHPNIARVLDAGTTRTGRLYFVMELVHGPRITDYCDRHRLDTRARLHLFIQICHAIQHAHQKGVIHRDIKPSNILVATPDGVPVPRVIDFGIAKVVENRAPDQAGTQASANQLFIGTPAYMSPEQADPGVLDIDTRSDVYSLGVLLYELLTARTPFDGSELVRSGLDQLRRTLREVDPPRPSALLARLSADARAETARLRRLDPSKLMLSLKGDLDWIVMKALEKDRGRRYETVNGLVADLNRFLANEPVIARPPSRIYRFSKLVRRNRVVFAAGTVVAVALLAGMITSTWLFVRERDARREQARLREQAEQAEHREAVLRRQAVARETITRAAIAVKSGDDNAADLLLESVKSFSPELSFDSVSAFRHVGEWHAIAGRWDKAAERFSALMEIDKLDTWEVITLDYQSCGVVLAESGDRARFETFCRAAVANFSTARNGDATARILKTLLLLPPAPDLLEGMRPMAQVTEAYWAARPPPPGQVMTWEVVPLALWSYRQGGYELAAQRCRHRLAARIEDPALDGICRIILALCEARMGDRASARARLAAVAPQIDLQFRNGLKREMSAGGYWYDWLYARILWREASGMLLTGER